MSKPTERRNYSSLKSKKPLKHPSLIKGQLIPISKNSSQTHNHSIAQIRSSSMSRSKPRSISRCASNANFYLKQKPNKGASSYSQLPSSSSFIRSSSTESSRIQKHNTADTLESRVKTLLKNLPTNPTQRFNKIQGTLQEVINRGEKGTLGLLKTAYQECFDYIKTSEVEVLQNQNTQLNKVIDQFKVDAKVMHRKIEKLSRENYDLSKSLDSKDAEFADLREKILQISSVNVDAIPKNIDTWKYIVTENKTYYDMCNALKGCLLYTSPSPRDS